VRTFVSRGGQKLDHALAAFDLSVAGTVAADLGCSTGGFTDCLLQHGAARVYAVDTGYGVLDYKLRKDPRVVVRERCNAMHVALPEPVGVVTVDASWTRQDKLLPNVARLLAPNGRVVTLIKPHYEADKAYLRRGILPAELVDPTVAAVGERVVACGFEVLGLTRSPVLGGQGNVEVLALLRRREDR
jgi:23S rRNA (cytidine1920-2'-O)/16S rRNA (cytidine1409-2'-O)-methyltransferase